MKKIALYFMLFSFLALAGCSESGSDLNEFTMDAVEIVEEDVADGPWFCVNKIVYKEGEERIREHYAYDETGKLTDKIEIEQYMWSNQEAFIYNEDGYVTEVISCNENDQYVESISFCDYYQEPEGGYSIEISGKDDWREVIRFNDKNMPIEECTYYDNSLEYCTNWLYNENGDLLTKRSYRLSFLNGYDYTAYYSYTETGCEVTVDYESGGVDSYNTYTLDDRGNLIEKCIGNQTITTYKYDENNFLVEEEHCWVGDEYGTRFTYTYDENGNLIKEEFFDGRGSVPAKTTVYEYIQISITEEDKEIYKKNEIVLYELDIMHIIDPKRELFPH